MSTRRIQKVSELIKQQLSELILEEFANNYSLLTVTEVIIQADLRVATVFISCFDKSLEASALKALVDKTPEFQKLLGKRLAMKFTPKLEFKIDKNFAQVDKVEEILKTLEK